MMRQFLHRGSSFYRGRVLLFCWFFGCFIQNALAEIGPGKQYFLVKDLMHECLVYDLREKEYVPFIAEQHNSQLAINTIIDLESNRHYDLLIYVEQENYLFFNGSLRENLKTGTWRIVNIDSLYKIYKQPQLMLTIYGTPGQAGKLMLIGHRKAAVEKLISVEEESFLNLKPRELSASSDFFILVMLLLLVFTAFLYNSYPRAFERIYNLSDLFQVDIRDESFLINKPFSRVNLLFVALLSLEIAYLYLFTQDKQYNLFLPEELSIMGDAPSDTWFNYLKVSLLCYAVLMGKYFSLYILGTLYRLEGMANIHYFKVIQSSLVFYSALLIITAVAAFYVRDWSSLIRNMLILPGVIFYMLRVVLIFFTISNSTTVKNLYLISYLCIVELIPLIIGVRYAL